MDENRVLVREAVEARLEGAEFNLETGPRHGRRRTKGRGAHPGRRLFPGRRCKGSPRPIGQAEDVPIRTG